MAYQDVAQNPMEAPQQIVSRYGHVGRAVRKGLQAQVTNIHKAAQLNNVPASDVALKILSDNKAAMLTWLQQNNIKPISDNPATMATQIAGAIMQGVGNVKSSYEGDGREDTFDDAFDEYMGSMLEEEMSNPYSKLHWSNNPGEMFGADGDGSGGVAAGEAVAKLGNVAADIPVIGSILGPIMQIGGGIIKGIGKKKAKEAEIKKKMEAERRAKEEAARLAAMQGPLGGAAGKKKMLLIGGAIAVILILIIVMSGKNK